MTNPDVRGEKRVVHDGFICLCDNLYREQITMTSGNIPNTSVGPMHDLTAFQRDLLVVIRELDAPHGLAIKEEMQPLYGGETINHGRLYPNLDVLAEKGLVSKGKIDDRSNKYEITERGKRELEIDLEWRKGGDQTLSDE